MFDDVQVNFGREVDETAAGMGSREVLLLSIFDRRRYTAVEEKRA